MRLSSKKDRNSVAIVLIIDVVSILLASWTTYQWLLANGTGEWLSRSSVLTLLHGLLLILLATSTLAISLRKRAFVWLLLTILAIYVEESVREYVYYLVIYFGEEQWIGWEGLSIRKAWVLASGFWWILLLVVNIRVLLGPTGRRYFARSADDKLT